MGKSGTLVSVEGVEPEILEAYTFAQLARQEWGELRIPCRTDDEFARRERVAVLVRSTAAALEKLISMIYLGSPKDRSRPTADDESARGANFAQPKAGRKSNRR